MLDAVREFTQAIEKQLFQFSQASLGDLARQQAGVGFTELEETLAQLAEINARAKASGIGFNLTKPNFNLIATAATAKPIHGKLLRQWWKEWGDAVRAAVAQQVRLGIAENESIDSIVRRILGTKARNYRDGILIVKRRNAEALVRTMVNHVASQAKNSVYEANDDVIEAVEWNATLDGRTTPICQARDGKRAAIGGRDQTSIPSGSRLKPPTARPPAHIGCRSTILPVITDWESLGLKNPPASTRASLNGQVANDLDYETWLKKQNKSFIRSVLGKKKTDLFLKGKVSLGRFVDLKGNSYTLEDMKRLNPKAWALAFGAKG
jgi:SPP1 gp7 family putative phage head morphogenesis protein